jgi:CMP-N,N'-diacetyllegionaminic acid synthase
VSLHRLAVILARAGSKGLPNKNILPLAGRSMIAYTIDLALQAKEIDAVCATTDSPRAADVARSMGVVVIDRPPELATDTATVDAACRHAVEAYEKAGRPVTHVAILYGNVPVRPDGVIDLAMHHLIETGADSVRSLARVTKQHPDWLHRLDGDRMIQFRRNSIYRRQDLEPLYYHDGAVLAVARRSLFTTSPDDNHAFLGRDRRGIVSEHGAAIDVDSLDDAVIAEALIRSRESSRPDRCPSSLAGAAP